MMDCEYWKDVVDRLRDSSRNNWASHVLSTSLHLTAALDRTNLGTALKCVPSVEIIKGTIYVYRDWSAQPYCDLILARFEPKEVLSIFRSIEHPEVNMKVGMPGYMEDESRSLAVELALSLDNADEDENVREAAGHVLRAT